MVEKNIKCLNYSSNKKIDLIIYKNNIPFIIFPIKFICRNYIQNRNNYLENLIGETWSIKQINKNIKVIPINILIQNINYYDKNNNLKKVEKINIKSIDIYKKINLFDDTINIFIKINYNTKKISKILYFDSLNKILHQHFFNIC